MPDNVISSLPLPHPLSVFLILSLVPALFYSVYVAVYKVSLLPGIPRYWPRVMLIVFFGLFDRGNTRVYTIRRNSRAHFYAGDPFNRFVVDFNGHTVAITAFLRARKTRITTRDVHAHYLFNFNLLSS